MPTHVQASPHPAISCSGVTFFLFAPMNCQISSHPGTSREYPRRNIGGVLQLGDVELPVYVLDNGTRVISRTGATGVLTEQHGKPKGGGNIESYLGVEGLRDYVPADLSGLAVEFEIKEVVNKRVQGYSAETFLEICRAYVRALSEGALQTDRQREIAVKASMFLAGCAKVGLIALIDEATGYRVRPCRGCASG